MIKEIKISLARKSDIPKISRLRIETLKKVSKKENDPNFIDEVIKDYSIKNIKKNFDNRLEICAYSGKRLVGCIFLDKSKIGGLYVKHNLLRKGIGSKLINYVEDIAKRNRIDILTLYPLADAIGFYRKKDFKLKRKRIIDLNGKKFIESVMTKKIRRK